MRIKTGEIATVRTTVDIEYQCSACGHKNSTSAIITGTAYTSTIMGVNVDRDVVGSAQKDLQNKLIDLLEGDNPKRFRKVGFVCKCKNCDHTEPWARMNYEHLETPKKISMVILMLSAILLSFGAFSFPYNIMHLVLLILFLLSIIGCICTYGYEFKNNKKQEELIVGLAKESLPVLLPHVEEEYNIFNNSKRSYNIIENEDEVWICEECGAKNGLQHEQCKKCGRVRS